VPSESHPDDFTSSADLVDQARQGDRQALDRLFARHVPPLRRWAAGRLPRWARDHMDTDDMIQETMLKTFRRLDEFEHRREGALSAYMRQALRRRILDELRRVNRQPQREDDGAEDAVDEAASPLEQTIGSEALERYELALTRLSDVEREAVVSRVEMGFDYDRIAVELGKPSRDAARMTVVRALARLAQEMGHER
jgi:RNA polymerase sigma-70 factor (ECF subfamily)